MEEDLGWQRLMWQQVADSTWRTLSNRGCHARVDHSTIVSKTVSKQPVACITVHKPVGIYMPHSWGFL